MGYSPWGRKESEMTELLTLSAYFVLKFFKNVTFTLGPREGS